MVGFAVNININLINSNIINIKDLLEKREQVKPKVKVIDWTFPIKDKNDLNVSQLPIKENPVMEEQNTVGSQSVGCINMNPLIFKCFPRFGIALTLNTDCKLGIPVAYCPQVVKKSLIEQYSTIISECTMPDNVIVVPPQTKRRTTVYKLAILVSNVEFSMREQQQQ